MKEMSWRLLLVSLFFVSCQTYTIPLESFRQQLTNSQARGFRSVTTQGPWGDRKTDETSAIDSILVLDKSGRHDLLPASPAVEVRFTDTANRKTVFYFDLMQLKNDSVFGGESRILPSLRKAIPLHSIRKIEIQNGRKHFRYVN